MEGHVGCPGPLSLELLPKTRPGLDPTEQGGPCAIFRFSWGQWEGWGMESFPVYSIYVSF